MLSGRVEEGRERGKGGGGKGEREGRGQMGSARGH